MLTSEEPLTLGSDKVQKDCFHNSVWNVIRFDRWIRDNKSIMKNYEGLSLGAGVCWFK